MFAIQSRSQEVKNDQIYFLAILLFFTYIFTKDKT